ncbi:hypothetical protein H8356DRAFT_1678655 [Neocallimastix lanati (nom. inval.)]|nr:hypothetical protein H8356DRAFT_1678655 [Neocallimastix sp. JGI-2020a]
MILLLVLFILSLFNLIISSKLVSLMKLSIKLLLINESSMVLIVLLDIELLLSLIYLLLNVLLFL